MHLDLIETNPEALQRLRRRSEVGAVNPTLTIIANALRAADIVRHPL